MTRLYIAVICTFVFLCTTKTSEAQVNMQLLSPPSPITANGIYVGPYAIAVNGTPTTLVCDDYVTETTFTPWTATVSTFADLSHTEFIGQSNSVQKYDAAAWLVQQMYALNPKGADYADQVIDIHYAIWSIFNSSAMSSPGFDSDSNNWYTTALANSYTAGEFANILIYTPKTGTAQEFMGETPEPASIALFGTGLLAVAGFIRRRSFGSPKAA
jgi:PEP-CTERM motif